MNRKFLEQSPTLHDAMVAYVRVHPQGVAAVELATLFLKLKNPAEPLAAAAIRGVLGSDRRCFTDNNGAWHANTQNFPLSLETPNLRDLPWSALFCLSDPDGRKLFFCSLWTIRPLTECVASAWITDPGELPLEEREVLTGSTDSVFDRESVAPFLETVSRACHDRMLLVLTDRERMLLSTVFTREQCMMPEATLLIGELLRAAEIPRSRPLSPASLERTILGSEGWDMNVAKQGQRFASCAYEIVDRLCARGFETLDDLDRALCKENAALFIGKDFSSDDLLALPASSGVYGFKDTRGAWLYIGKAVNLRRRLLSYFCETDESPEKVRRLIAESQSLITYPCGSELESLILEYRLIKKYTPILNEKTDINERKGYFKPIGDCIVLLPHTRPEMGMSLWYREGQKILLKPFRSDFSIKSPLMEDLHSFFFTGGLPPQKSDFPELEIATRWIKRAGDDLAVVWVDRAAGASELYDAMCYAWKHFLECTSRGMRQAV
jgi:hypothetical protein